MEWLFINTATAWVIHEIFNKQLQSQKQIMERHKSAQKRSIGKRKFITTGRKIWSFRVSNRKLRLDPRNHRHYYLQYMNCTIIKPCTNRQCWTDKNYSSEQFSTSWKKKGHSKRLFMPISDEVIFILQIVLWHKITENKNTKILSSLKPWWEVLHSLSTKYHTNYSRF